jgi:dihydroorotase
MNPPLRSQSDLEAVRQGLADGTIDVIACDHAPHVPEDKDVEFDAAAFGVIGLETSLGVALTHLVNPGIITPLQLVEKMSLLPSRILGVKGGQLSTGRPADITLIDPHQQWRVEPNTFFSKARNCPFENDVLSGRARMTITDGYVVYEQRTE